MTPLSFKMLTMTRRQGLLLSALLSIIAAGLGLVPYIAVYLIAAHLFERGIASADLNYVLTIAGGSLIAAIVKALTMVASLHVSHIAAFDILYETRLALARKLGTLPLGYFDQRATGTIKRVIHEHVEKTEEVLAHIVPDMAAALAVPLLSFVLLLMVDWRLALLLLVSPLIGILLFGIMNQQFGSKQMKTYNRMVDHMNSTIIQYINGIKVIKAFTRSQSSFADIKQVVDEMFDFYTQMGRDVQRIYSGVPVAFRTGPLIILPAGLLMHLNNSLDLPTLLLFLLMSLGFARPIYNFLLHGMMAFYQIGVSVGSIDKLLNEDSLPEPRQPQQPQNTDIVFRDVTFSYHAPVQDQPNAPLILNRVSFSIPAGSVTALVGPSGAGKTTIARLIPRFWDIHGGSIEIGGVDIRQMHTTTLMDTVSFVFQDVFLFNDTVYENIRIGNPNASRDQIITAARLARCHEFIEELGGYDYHVGENGAKLSGGQRQRLSIARAILKNAPIIVLDEATAFVDPENEGLIQEAIAALLTSNPDKPKTLVIVAHRLSTITEADQILVVDEGRIQAQGRHLDLLASSDLYRTLWSAHSDASKWQFDSDVETETLTVNRNTAYDGAVNAMDNPFEPLKTAKGHWDRVRGLVGRENRLFRRGVLWTLLEGNLIAYPAIIIYLALLVINSATLTTRDIALYSLGLLLIFAGQYVFSFLAYTTFLRLDTRIQSNLRLFLSDYLRRLPLGFFTQRDVGYIDSLFTTTIEFIETRLSTAMFVAGVVAPAMIFVFTLFLDWRMALAMGASIPFALIIMRRGLRVFDQVWHAQREARKLANSRMVEYIQGISVIRAFNLPGERFTQFEQAMNRYRIASRETVTRISAAMSGFGSVLEIGFALMLIVGTWLAVQGSLSFAGFLIFMLLGTSFYAPIMMLGEMASLRRILASGVNNLNEFLQTPTLPEPTICKQPNGYAITFEDVHFGYEDEKVLNGVSFTIPEKSMVALVGPSGSGKTTITNLIARFWDVQAGSVKVGGVDVREMASDVLLSQITMVFQDVYLFKDTIMNNLRFANPSATDEQVFAAARLARAHDFIVALPDGYEMVVGEGGSTLSGGQKQRISIARALLKDAPIVLLDEATASIDPENERLIQQAFNALVRNKTVIIIAHRLSTVQNADMILVLKDGQLIQQGAHAELMRQEGLYQHFWQEREKSRSWKLGSAAATQLAADLGAD
jgi:ATP-binding cassette, subfamily B, bacterial